MIVKSNTIKCTHAHVALNNPNKEEVMLLIFYAEIGDRVVMVHLCVSSMQSF